ncbi:MAG: DciA family protein [Paludibacteraceae bacterium]
MKRRNTEKLSVILGQVLKQNHLDGRLYETRVINSWASVLGDTVNQYTEKLFFKDGTLYVTLSSAVLRHELFLEREQIKKSLNTQVCANIVKNIVFQ